METFTPRSEPELSFVMPCYNEQDIIGYTIPRFTAAFRKAGIKLELIAVDNGSRDRTGEMIREMAANDPAIVYHRVEVNEGYGNGILRGIKVCRASWIGIIPCDGQVDAEDVVALFDSVKTTNGNVLAKVRRRFRMDGLWRKVVSVGYNLMVRALWPRLGSIDVNGSPKILPRDALIAMDLKSKNWFLDPEIVIKAHYMGLRVLEFNVFARMRGNGLSHVRVMTCWEFLRNLMIFRFSPEMPKWRRRLNSELKNDKTTAAITH
ncbi:MAG TPA: glycosyltransferase family 2 protein [Blastocatellia bacterium]|nr:glycosyltransferase family 2 protein [Blastocatellia bacterium]